MSERNRRVQARYDELRGIGRHGHYETMFQVVNEECQRLEAENARLREVLEVYHAGRCYACGWTLAKSINDGCVPGNCSYRPEPNHSTYSTWHKRMLVLGELLNPKE